MASDYKAILQALPEPIRTRLLKGTFVAEKAIEPGAVIPLEWVVSAQRAWTVMSPGPADSLGVSAAAGVAVTPRHGKWFGPSRLLWAEAPQEGAVVAERLGELAQGGRIQIELDGRGATILDAARRRGLPALPLDGMARSTARERTGRFGFADARSEWWWKLREALNPDSRSAVQIAPDSELASELAAPHWRVGSRGMEIEGPVDIIRRLGRPADKAEPGPRLRRGRAGLTSASPVRAAPRTLPDRPIERCAESPHERILGLHEHAESRHLVRKIPGRAFVGVATGSSCLRSPAVP